MTTLDRAGGGATAAPSDGAAGVEVEVEAAGVEATAAPSVEAPRSAAEVEKEIAVVMEIFQALDVGDAAGLTETQAIHAVESYAQLEGGAAEQLRALVRGAPHDGDGLVAVEALARAISDAEERPDFAHLREVIHRAVEVKVAEDEPSDDDERTPRERLHADTKRLLHGEGSKRTFASTGGAGMQIDLHSGFQYGDTFKLGPPRRATEADPVPLFTGAEKMRMDWILVMVLHDRVESMPCHIKKLLKFLKIAGWRRTDDEWRAVVADLAAHGSIRATVADDGRPFEVFWPDARDEDTKKAIEDALHLEEDDDAPEDAAVGAAAS